MFKRVVAFVLLFCFCFFNVVFASDISASAYITMDADTGVVLSERNSRIAYPMASTTKIMTCLIACESDKLNNIVTITPKMLDGAYGSMIYLKPDDQITLLDLVKGAMLSSGNDAANSIAVYLGGDIPSFIRLMNLRAKQIGMKDTLFVTPSGLDKGNHHSTAYDMALLAKLALNNKILSSVFLKSSDTICINNTEQTIYNHNKLLSQNGFVGIKTGFTDKAGRCLVSAYKHNNSTIITVTLNAPNDWNDHKQLVDNAKQRYSNYYNTLNFCQTVVGGAKNSVKCCAKYNLYTLNKITTKAYYYPFSYAPISIGDTVGYVNIYCNQKLIKTVEIIALEEVKNGK